MGSGEGGSLLVDPTEGMDIDMSMPMLEEGIRQYEEGLNPDRDQQVPEPDRAMLTDSELGSPLWEKLEKHMKRELFTLRMLNDQPIEEVDTYFIRGKIQAIKDFLSLAEKPGPKKGDDDLEPIHIY